MRKLLNKLFVGFLIIQLVLFNTVPVVVAQEVPADPTPSPEVSASTATTESPAPESPSPDTTATTSTTTDTTATTTPETEQTAAQENTTAAPADTTTETNNTQQNTIDPTVDRDAYKAEQERLARLAWEQANPQLAALAQSNGTGDTAVVTGDSTSNGAIISTGNNNLASGGGDGSSASIVNSGNGSSSTNNGSATIVNDSDTNQDNSATVLSGLHGDSTTGDNDASFNVGNSSLVTGDANTTGTILSALNTNVDGVMVSEFNILDDHVGDIVLDFAANCISGCGDLGVNAANSDNGAFSDNTADASLTNNNNTFQNNDGTVGNELILSADSGNNTANFNTGGDSSIRTGDANVAANALTFLNNNIAGNVIYSVVNIFGDLVGDIIFPESQLNCCGMSNVGVSNTGNGAFSDNTANASLTNNDTTFQTNDATINNNLVFDAQTGNNSTSYNTGGNSAVSTGNANVDANILNFINTNITGGNMWLVLINHAGNWVGKIMGADSGASYAGSEGLEFSVGANGEINVSNNGNGAASDNTATATTTNNNTTTQNNNATVNNTLNLSANTGNNSSSFNTGGNSNIQTGDANIIANLVNFVNNNISGGGKLFVSVINVFGSWAGDFVGPGQEKQNKEVKSENQSSSNNGSHNANSSNSNSSNQLNTSNSSGSNPVSAAVSGAANFLTKFTPSSNSPQTSTTSNTGSARTGDGLLASADVKVAGAAGTKDGTQEKKIKINLAWLVLLLPITLLVIMLRKLAGKRINK